MVDASFFYGGSTGGGATYLPITYGYGIYQGTGTTAVAAAPAPPPIAPAAVAISTGVNPVETSYSLYGHIVPLSVFGVGRIGGEIISGPWIENGLASFIISFGVPADPTGTRILREIAFDSEVVWTGSLTGAGTPSSSGFSTAPFTCRFYDGNLTQAADALETTHFGADAVAYRPQILLAFENLPLANTKFKKIPYVAAVIGDTSGDDVNLGEAFERLAYSPWVGYTSAQFETSGITDGLVSGGLIIAQDTEFLQLIQQFGRFYTSWDILQTDKLRIVDRGGVGADISLDTTRLMDKIAVTRQGQDTVKKDLELSTIDPNADYTIVPSVAQRPRDPVAVTTSVGRDSAFLPAIMDSSTRVAIVTLAKYHEEATRKTISGTAMAYGLEIEPGSRIAIRNLNDDFHNETFKVMETLHGANYVVEFTAAAILKCAISGGDTYWDNVVLLLGFPGADGSTTITDESPAAHGIASVFGNAQVDTAQSQFGGSSGLFDGTGDTLNFADDSDFALGTGRWTVEAWIRPATVAAGTRFIVGQWGNLDIFDPSVDLSWVMYQSGSSLVFNYSNTGVDSNVLLAGGTMSANTGYAACVDYDGTTARAYIDGVMVDSFAITTLSMADCSKPLAIGGNSDNAAFFFNGNMDEVRITKGVARYASDSGYTVATSAFPRF